MTPPSPANERMTMGIPVGGCLSDGLTDLFPGLETSPLESQGAQRLPPGLNQVQVGCVGRLKDKFPAWMLQGKQQHVSRSMHGQIIQDGVDALDALGNPLLDLSEKIEPVLGRSPLIGSGQCLCSSGLKGPEDVALGSASIVDLLLGAPSGFVPFWISLRMHQLLPQKSFRRLRPHFIQVHDGTPLGRGCVERGDRPLCLAKSGSSRSPNQCSSLRQRSPSASKISLIRLRVMAIPFS